LLIIKSNCINTASGIVTLKTSEMSTITLINNAANYIIVILDNSVVFRVTVPVAVLIQFDLLRMSKILLETCRGL
jgi:hypothetical protein